MEASAAAKRSRGRPRNTAPPHPSIHVRLSPPLKARLEADAEKANRSVRKEIELRLENSYRVEDEIYGGPKMAALFREMAKVADGVALKQNIRSFFDDFRAFVFVKDVWDHMIRDEMPRPDVDLLADVCQRWDAGPSQTSAKAGPPPSSEEQAALEWLTLNTLRSMPPEDARARLVEILAEGRAQAGSQQTRTRKQASDTQAEESAPSSGSAADPQSVISGFGSLHRLVGAGVIPPPSQAPSEILGSIGSLAMVMQSLVRSEVTPRKAAETVSRLARLLADEAEPATGNDAAVPPTPSAESAERAGSNGGVSS